MTPTVNEDTAVQNTGSILSNLGSIDIGSIILQIIGALIIVGIFIVLGKVLAGMVRRNIISHSTEDNKEHSYRVANLMRDITFYIMVIFAFFIGFEMVGFNVGLILGGISFGVGLAFKEILGNMIAGMMILYTKELKLGDVIEIDGDQKYFGRIEQITIRYTTIRTLDLRQVILPNMTLISAPIKTFSAESIVKLNTTIGLHYNCDVDKAISVIIETINKLDFIKEKESTKCYITSFDESEVVLKCIFFFDPNAGMLADYVIGHIHEEIFKAFAANGLQMAYPHVTLTFDDPGQQQAVQSLLQQNTKQQTKF